MKPSFINKSPRPQLVTILTDKSPEACIATMRNAAYDGTDAYGIMLDSLDVKYHKRKHLEHIFAYAADKPILTMNYRNAVRSNEGITEQDLVDSQLLAIESGATMCDIMGDMFDPSPLELSTKPEIIDKQRRLVERIHSMGGEVLMSSHTWVFMNAEQTIEHFRTLAGRGADMVKIAMCAHNEDELFETVNTTMLLKRELDIPFLHVCMGQYGKVHRVISSIFGSELVLCVQAYTSHSHLEQPLLRSTKAVLDNIDCLVARNDQLGTRKSSPQDGEVYSIR